MNVIISTSRDKTRSQYRVRSQSKVESVYGRASSIMKKIKSVLISVAIIVGAIFSLNVFAQSMTGSGTVVTHTFDASKNRTYKVYIPQSYNGSHPVSMIMALHGCDMNNTDALNVWNFDLIADRENVIVVYPYVGQFSEIRAENCWGYYIPQHIQEGGGGEVDYLYDVALEVEANYMIDPEARFITGFNSGGGMAIAEAIAHNEYWTSAAPVAGFPYGDWIQSLVNEPAQYHDIIHHVDAINAELNYDRAVPMLLVQSTNDTIVQKRSMELIRDSQLIVWGGDFTADAIESCGADGIGCALTTYNGSTGSVLVKTLVYDGDLARTGTYGRGHYWTGGDDALNIWSYSRGPIAAEHIWNFFSDGGVCNRNYAPPAPPSSLTLIETRDSEADIHIGYSGVGDFDSVKVYQTGHIELTSLIFHSDYVTITGLTPGTEYEIYATNIDSCGTETGPSPYITFTTTAPEVEYIDTAYGHYSEGRLDYSGWLAMVQKYGYSTQFQMWQLESGSWTDSDPSLPATCEEMTSYNYYHQTSGRAVNEGSIWAPSYKTVGSGELIPGGTWSYTTLTTVDGSFWSLGACP